MNSIKKVRRHPPMLLSHRHRVRPYCCENQSCLRTHAIVFPAADLLFLAVLALRLLRLASGFVISAEISSAAAIELLSLSLLHANISRRTRCWNILLRWPTTQILVGLKSAPGHAGVHCRYVLSLAVTMFAHCLCALEQVMQRCCSKSCFACVSSSLFRHFV